LSGKYLSIMKNKNFSETIKQYREEKKMLIREAAALLNVDASLYSRFEKGTRLPSKEQVKQIAVILDVPENDIRVLWLSDKLMQFLKDEDTGLEALMVAEERVKYNAIPKKADNNKTFGVFLNEIDELKKELTKHRNLDSYKIVQALELEYTYESNKIEGNTLTLQETDIVVNEGITISGKSMREHLEAINHKDAIDFVKHLITNKNAITESNVLAIHNLILRGIDVNNAGRYRNVQVMIKGSKHLPPQPYLVAKQMEEMYIWYNNNKKVLHPILLAAEMHERLVTIHPFIDGNGRTSRLLMNLILLQHGYVIANIKGDNTNRLSYYNALEKCQVENNKNDFLQFVLQIEKDCLVQYLKIIGIR
jgi:fido (protein-threonine AMPylation protein)/DNA-binding XRE family transcriptional regulator